MQKKDSPYVYMEDGVLIVEGGRIKQVGEYAILKNKIKGIKQIDYQNKLITPGFINTLK